ncbi:maleylpyruvate isomerase family mycothiol-dependent enzyme [Streptomyces sp. PTM05]|uniref:Maleylpyruvate isomerase family mycothiol-dependent enzyme n=1 Tax=Streptantibioticus parmotrematis TaxID=2873249 RepID=A0ABS7QW14_9ACTN|nr:maleylpyruvate isomerase family mycothiol-dependent enzyme [Streptantibioticus parmotrematis]
MSVQRLDPVSDAAEVRDATAALFEAASALAPDAVTGPSLLPGWTRGHVMTHLARNSDALVNLLTWARTGEERAMYVSEEARNKDIEDGASRPLPEQLADLRRGADALAEAMDAMPPQAWAAQVRTRHGGVRPAAQIPMMRLRELHLHLVDLDVGRTCADLPAGFVARDLAALADGLSGREGIPAVRLRCTDSGETWNIGNADEPELTVSGPAGALLAWVTGRSRGEDLTADPQAPLPVLPPLG